MYAISTITHAKETRGLVFTNGSFHLRNTHPHTASLKSFCGEDRWPATLRAPMKAVFFDIGETLIEETRDWSIVADWLGVPRMTMFTVLGSLIEQGRDHRELFDIMRPNVGWKGVNE